MTDSDQEQCAALAPLGLDADAEVLYRVVLRHPGASAQTLGQLVGWPLDTVSCRLDGLVRLGLVRRGPGTDGAVVADPPDRAVADLLQREHDRLVHAQTRLATARLTVSELLAEHRAGYDRHTAGAAAAGLEVIEPADTVDVIGRLLAETTGDLWHLRRDQWALPGAEIIDARVIQELAGGRTSRAIYPVAALRSHHRCVLARAEAGEQVRVLVDVPSRLVVFGTEAALLTERWGAPEGSRVVVRQAGLVLALRELAGALWDRAVTPPRLHPRTPRVDGARRTAVPLLALMAGGAVDEQIARALGVSVRTVRRRIATLLAELGADSRFQAGAEAVRRGWI